MAIELFPDIDLDVIPEVPEDGTHLFTLRSYLHGESQWDGKTYLTLDYILDDPESPFNGYKLRKKLWLPTHGETETSPTEAIKAINAYKAWMRSHGVEEEDLNAPDLDSLTGMQLLVYGRGYDSQAGKRWGANNAKRA